MQNIKHLLPTLKESRHQQSMPGLSKNVEMWVLHILDGQYSGFHFLIFF